MKAQVRRWMARYDALNRRERIMVLAAVWLFAAFVLDAALVSPALRERAGSERLLGERRAEKQRVEAELAALRAGTARDPDAATRARMIDAEKRIRQVETELKGAEAQMVPPERMASVLDQVLRRNRGLQLVSLRNLPVEPVLKTESAGAPTSGAPVPPPGQPMVYRHGVELTLRGGYYDILDYLEQVERLPWRMHWGRMEMKVEEYPKARLALTFYTFSTDQTWLKI